MATFLKLVLLKLEKQIAIDDVKSLPEEADHLEKCEEEIAALRTKRDEEISKKQDEICIIGYDAEKLDLLTVKANSGNDTVNTIKEKLKELINEMSGELATRLLESYANMPT